MIKLTEKCGSVLRDVAGAAIFVLVVYAILLLVCRSFCSCAHAGELCEKDVQIEQPAGGLPHCTDADVWGKPMFVFSVVHGGTLKEFLTSEEARQFVEQAPGGICYHIIRHQNCTRGEQSS
jgi:hypothetical protein